MKKYKEKCMQIYEENKSMVYWYLKTKCTWLSEQDVHNILMVVWKELAENIDEVYKLKNRKSQAAWVLTVVRIQAEKLKGKETNEEKQ